MNIDEEKAHIMLKLVRKGNWNNGYDRSEHFKRFEYLDSIIKELNKIGWIMIHKKPKFIAYSLNTNFKKDITEFIEKIIPEVSGTIR